MSLDDLRNQTQNVKLNLGDMLIDLMTGQIGLLVQSDHRISTTHDDIYFWYVKWTCDKNQDVTSVVNPIWMEEEGLKLSILVGMYDLHSTIEEKF